MTTMQQIAGRHWPPERMLARLLSRRHVFHALIVFVVAILIRLPFRAAYLVNWDAVNFALGIESFNLEHHQPHPPGYLGYVALGRLVNWVVGDPVIALTAISIISGAAATMWVYVLGTRLGNERVAVIAAVLFGTSPLVWYYSEVALTYIVEAALALPLVWLAMEARRRRSARLLLAATVLLALMGALRQTSLVLFLPVWIYAWLPFTRRQKWMAAGALSGLVALWLIPLLILSGGPLAYVQLSRDLAQLTGGVTWFGAGLGMLQNFVVVLAGLILGLHVSLFAIPLAAFRRNRPEPLPEMERRFMWIWAVPPLVVYLLVHSGQLGYVLILLPIGIFWAARVFDRWLGASRGVLALATLLILVNFAGFSLLPEIAYAAVAQGRVGIPERVGSPWLFERSIRQVSLQRSDAHWDALVVWVDQFDTTTTAILAEPRDGGSFRHLSFYLPDHLVYGIGTDRDGRLGHLFTGLGHEIDYSVERLDEAASRLRLPSSVRTLVVPDPHLQELLAGILDFEYVSLADGSQAAVAEVQERSSILFMGQTGVPLMTSWAMEETVMVEDGADGELLLPGTCRWPPGEEAGDLPLGHATAAFRDAC